MNDVFTPNNTRDNIQLPFVHTITSKNTENKEVLIVTGYDYFLQKRDLKLILQKYVKIILIPRLVTDIYYLGVEVGKIIENYETIHLVNNPAYDAHHNIIYTLGRAVTDEMTRHAS
ncbi:MAG: hypothetical protein MUE30_05970 [Spirosomaceae bacterium]|nr:hypothetical protein [Spirosomataceae bacterium]